MSKPKIFIVFYSAYGHAKAFAEKVKEGVDEAGAEGILYQVAETLPAEVLEKMHAPPKPWPGIPVIDASLLPEADGIIFGFPSRFGTLPAQVKALLDSTGGLWAQGKLLGKPVSVFVGSGTQGGGQETVALSFVPFAVHQGMIFVPPGYSNPAQFNMEEIHGGSAWGAGFLAGGDGSRQASELELSLAKGQGTYFSGVVKTLVAGKKALA